MNLHWSRLLLRLWKGSRPGGPLTAVRTPRAPMLVSKFHIPVNETWALGNQADSGTRADKMSLERLMFAPRKLLKVWWELYWPNLEQFWASKYTTIVDCKSKWKHLCPSWQSKRKQNCSLLWGSGNQKRLVRACSCEGRCAVATQRRHPFQNLQARQSPLTRHTLFQTLKQTRLWAHL